nr:hypothetical protein [Shinella zoogloeoides]
MDAVGDALGIRLVRTGKEDAKLVAGDTAHDIALPDGPANGGGDPDESFVAPAITEAIVDDREVIDMNEQDGSAAGAVRGCAAVRIGIDERRECGLVETGRQPVTLPEMLDLPAQGGDPFRHAAAGVEKRKGYGERHPAGKHGAARCRYGRGNGIRDGRGRQAQPERGSTAPASQPLVVPRRKKVSRMPIVLMSAEFRYDEAYKAGV